jgi:hypothetical protein
LTVLGEVHKLRPVGRSLVLLALLCWLPQLAHAAHPRVRAAQRAYDELRFQEVLREIQAARQEGPMPPADEIELLRLEAYTYSVFDDQPRAVDAFRQLLRRKRDFRLPANTSPKIRSNFADAKAALARERPRPLPVKKEDTPFYKSGWFWGGLAAAVAIGVGVFLITPSEPSAD